MSQKRSSFSGKLGFILAAAGSAVGLGNIWRFPYLAAEYGGGIFLLTYIVLAFTLGFVLLCTEIAIGRKTGKSSILAYKKLHNKFGFLGYLAASVPILILPYYQFHTIRTLFSFTIFPNFSVSFPYFPIRTIAIFITFECVFAVW